MVFLVIILLVLELMLVYILDFEVKRLNGVSTFLTCLQLFVAKST